MGGEITPAVITDLATARIQRRRVLGGLGPCLTEVPFDDLPIGTFSVDWAISGGRDQPLVPADCVFDILPRLKAGGFQLPTSG